MDLPVLPGSADQCAIALQADTVLPTHQPEAIRALNGAERALATMIFASGGAASRAEWELNVFAVDLDRLAGILEITIQEI